MKSLEREFQRFRNRGDARALGRVFDRSAPVLWRVAGHLAADPAEADDLVQSTFLTAIEKASSWDANRPLLPWLLGILALQARRARRRARRHPDPDRLSRPAVSTPDEEAGTRELEQAVGEAIEKLPGAYRETLRKHLVHGLGAAEIARRTGQRQGTVRMRIHRGLSLLKAHLPRGLLGAGVAFVPSAAARAGVRAKVLAALPAPAAAAATWSTPALLGALPMKKFLSGLFVIVIVALGAWQFWPSGNEAPPPGTDTRGVVRAPLPEPTSDRATSPQDAAPAGRPARRELPAEREGRVVVRVVRAASGEPVPGLDLVWSCRRVLYARTDENGVHVFEDRPGVARITSSQGFEARVRVAPGKTIEHVVELPTELELELHVVDPSGNPVPGARILASRGGDWGFPTEVLGTTDERGVWRHACVSKAMSVAAEADGRTPSATVHVRSEENRRALRFLQLGGPAVRVGGTVLDTDGRPAPGALVVVQLERERYGRGSPELIVARSDARGHYASACVPPGHHLLFAFEALEHTADPLAATALRKKGRRTIEVAGDGLRGADVQLVAGGSIYGTVRGVSGHDLDELRILATPLDTDIRAALRREISTSTNVRADGDYVVEGLLPGRYSVACRLGDREVRRELAVEDRRTVRWDPRLEDSPRVRVLLRGPGRRPLAGWRVLVAARTGFGRPRSKTADAGGTCRFENLGEGLHLVLAWSPRSSLPVLCRTFRPRAGDVVVRVPKHRMPTARLHGRVLARTVPLDRLSVKLVWAPRGTDGRPIAIPRSCRRTDLEVDPESGRFASGALSPGDYFVTVEQDDRPLASSDTRTLIPDSNVDVGTLVVDAPSSLRIVVEGPDGGTLTAFHVQARTAPRGRWRRLPGEIDGEGFLATRIPPGDFEILVSSATTAPAIRRVRVTPGQRTRIDVRCPRGTPCLFQLPNDDDDFDRARVRVRNSEGLVVAEIGLLGRGDRRERRTGLAPGRYELEVLSGPRLQRRSLRKLEVPERTEPLRIVVR